MECDGISEPKTNSVIEEEEEEVLDAKHTKFTSKETLYYKMIDRFFRGLTIEDKQKMMDVIDGQSKVSLRLLDWFVTRYANKYKTTYNLMNGERFNVHISYKAQLKSYKKRYFDPFRRRKKFVYGYDQKDSKKTLCTTIGQLNFFRWAFLSDVIKYVENHYAVILKAMVKSNKDDKVKKTDTPEEETKDETVKLVKNSINITAEKKMSGANGEMKIVLSFD